MIGDGDDYPAIERAAATRFARLARAAGVERLIYLGGLGEEETSKHLTARHDVAEALAAAGPPLTYFRAAMVIGSGSRAYELLRGIVERLRLLPAPDWLHTKTQPIGAADVVDYLREALDVPESAGREIEIGGPEVVSPPGARQRDGERARPQASAADPRSPARSRAPPPSPPGPAR